MVIPSNSTHFHSLPSNKWHFGKYEDYINLFYIFFGNQFFLLFFERNNYIYCVYIHIAYLKHIYISFQLISNIFFRFCNLNLLKKEYIYIYIYFFFQLISNMFFRIFRFCSLNLLKKEYIYIYIYIYIFSTYFKYIFYN